MLFSAGEPSPDGPSQLWQGDASSGQDSAQVFSMNSMAGPNGLVYAGKQLKECVA